MLLFLALACNERLSPCEEAALHDPTLVIAAGEERPTPIASGEVLERVWGPQGGQHVWVGALVSGLDPGEELLGRIVSPGPDFEFSLDDESGSAWAWGARAQWPLDGDAARAELAGVTLMLDDRLVWQEESEEPLPETFTLRAYAIDACGVEVEAELPGLSLAP